MDNNTSSQTVEVDYKKSVQKSEPLSAGDKAILLEHIHQKIDILEDKKTHFGNNQKKNTAWEEIAKKFSARGSISRNAEQLKTWWKNSKSRAKSDVIDFN